MFTYCIKEDRTTKRKVNKFIVELRKNPNLDINQFMFRQDIAGLDNRIMLECIKKGFAKNPNLYKEEKNND